MKKIIFPLIIFLFVVSCVFAQSSNEDRLTVYCYDSFAGDWGAGNKIVSSFKEKTGIDVSLVSCGGAVETYSKVLFEGKSCNADVVVGINDSTNVKDGLFCDYKMFDYGVFAFVWDSNSTTPAPESLWDLTDPVYKGKVILVDPRTSTVGLGLLKWTVCAFGMEKAMKWWEIMKENALTIASSWSSAYGLFTEGEADIVISYTTSPVYHQMYENTTRYKALEFKEGHIRTCEYAGITQSSSKKEKAKLFLDFILNEGQADIAVANTMFPANEKTELPQEFSSVPKAALIKDTSAFDSNIEEIIDLWTRTVV